MFIYRPFVVHQTLSIYLNNLIYVEVISANNIGLPIFLKCIVYQPQSKTEDNIFNDIIIYIKITPITFVRIVHFGVHFELLPRLISSFAESSDFFNFRFNCLLVWEIFLLEVLKMFSS